MDSEGDDIDRLMQTAQKHDQQDEIKRDQASKFMPVSSQPASRALFDLAKPKLARIVLAEDCQQGK